MKLENAKISMLINREFTEIEIIDANSNTTLAVIKLSPEQLSAILSRQAHVNCECITGDLSRIGKKHENEYFEFEIPEKCTLDEVHKICKVALLSSGMNEWTPDNYYASQNSFFSKDGKRYARAIIRRWV